MATDSPQARDGETEKTEELKCNENSAEDLLFVI